VAGHRYRQHTHGPPGAPRQRPARSVRQVVPDTPPVVTAVLAAVEAAALALSRPSPDTPNDHQGRVSGLSACRRGGAPLEGDPSARAAPRLCDPSPRSGGGSAADPPVAGPSQLANDQSLPPCHPACSPRDTEPPRYVAPGRTPMNRPA